MSASLAELDQLSARLGITLDPESPAGKRGQATLDDASALIRQQGSEWSDAALVPAIIQAVCLAVALRAYSNPTGAVQASVGDVAVSYGASASGGAIYLLRPELAAVRKAAGRSLAGSVSMTTDIVISDPQYAEVEQGGDAIPMGPWPWEE